MLAAATPLGANAQAAYPSKPIKIIVPYPPGGAVDVVTRKMAQKLTEQMGQSIIVDNKPGGTGTIGASAAARAEADGYTLMANDTTYSLLPFIFKKLPFDYDKDLVPGQRVRVRADGHGGQCRIAVQDPGRVPRRCEGRPGQADLWHGRRGHHAAFHCGGIRRGQRHEADARAFQGREARPLQAVLSNTIDMQFSSTPGVMGNVKGGKLRLLAVSGDKRLVALPAVPTFAEAGVKNFSVVNWTGLWAPKGTPAPVLARLQQEIASAMATPDMKAFAEGLGAEPRMADAAAFAKMLTDSNALWGKIAANASIRQAVTSLEITLFLLQPPQVRDLELFTRMPDALRRRESSAWAGCQPRRQPTDSFLEGPVFDDQGNLYVTDIPFGRIFRIDPAGAVVAGGGIRRRAQRHEVSGRPHLADHRLQERPHAHRRGDRHGHAAPAAPQQRTLQGRQRPDHRREGQPLLHRPGPDRPARPHGAPVPAAPDGQLDLLLCERAQSQRRGAVAGRQGAVPGGDPRQLRLAGAAAARRQRGQGQPVLHLLRAQRPGRAGGRYKGPRAAWPTRGWARSGC